MKTFQKILAMVLVASIFLCTALTVSATEAVENEVSKDSGINDLLNAGSVNPLTGEETAPYISAPDASVLLAKENELLPATATSFLDTAELRSGKIYTYYVVDCYDNEAIRYTTMNPESSDVVWGIPQLTNDAVGEMLDDYSAHSASIIGSDAIDLIISFLALTAATAAIVLAVSLKKKETEEET